jgi:thiosulfate dehydrogenase (quinone) large subunit
LHDAVKEVRAALDDSPPVTEIIVVGDTGTTLALESRRADLLLVDSHDRGRSRRTSPRDDREPHAVPDVPVDQGPSPASHRRRRREAHAEDENTRREAMTAFSHSTAATGVTARATAVTAVRADAGAIALAVLRITTGFVFLWAFLDKVFGLGYATKAANAWINGGSPTKGFLSRVAVGPFESAFHAIAGTWWADWLFMLGLLAIGVAVIAGIGLRLAAIAGTLMMLLMWAAEWPLTRFTSTGEPSMSTNPVIDYHIVYAAALIAVALAGAGATWGLGRRWATLPVVRDHAWLR